jgi:hypothetical protein
MGLEPQANLIAIPVPNGRELHELSVGEDAAPFLADTPHGGGHEAVTVSPAALA